jgi:dolichol-phosphate mannosyltransferase
MSMTEVSATKPARVRVSLMIPCYNEEVTLTHVIPTFVESVVADPDFEFELLFIDDHSTDRTPLILRDFCQRYPDVRAIRLGRNCGSHMAYRAGLDFCTGEAVAFAVADLQEGLDLIRQSLKLWRAGASVVGTVAIGRDRGGFLNEAGARVFYWIRRRLRRGDPDRAAEAALRVIDREVVEHCRRFAPRVRNLNTWVFGQPFSTEFVSYTPTERQFGASRWTFRRKVQLAVDTFLDASPVFLTIWGAFGAVLAVVGLLLAVFSPTLRSDLHSSASVALLAGVMIGCTGLILMALGVLGSYAWRIIDELRGGPGYFVQPLGGFTASAPTEDRTG